MTTPLRIAKGMIRNREMRFFRLTAAMSNQRSRDAILALAFGRGAMAGAHDVLCEDPRGSRRGSPNYNTSAEWAAWRDGWLHGATEARESDRRSVAGLEISTGAPA